MFSKSDLELAPVVDGTRWWTFVVRDEDRESAVCRHKHKCPIANAIMRDKRLNAVDVKVTAWSTRIWRVMRGRLVCERYINDSMTRAMIKAYDKTEQAMPTGARACIGAPAEKKVQLGARAGKRSGSNTRTKGGNPQANRQPSERYMFGLDPEPV